MSSIHIVLPDHCTFQNAGAVYQDFSDKTGQKSKIDKIILDFSKVQEMDSAGAVTIHKMEEWSFRNEIKVETTGLGAAVRETLELFKSREEAVFPKARSGNMFERLGAAGYTFIESARDFVFLLSNISYFSVAAMFKPSLRRKGEVINQSVLVGVNALPIISLIAFLIGFILALQSAAQLSQFGANIYVADLVAVAMVSEMGPLMTAIMVAGRSASSFAAELSTMKVSEEIDALRVMGIDAVPYNVIPKLYALTITMPLLTTFANVIGILGGLLIGVTYLDLDVMPFVNEVLSVLRYKEVLIYVLKSLVFAFIITLSGAFFGFRVKGGAEGVGRSTTAAVVFAIFMVIVADSIIGLLFYFET